MPQLQEFTAASVEQGLKRALTAYAIARGINGAISMAQDTDVALSPAGLGVTFSPGELLDPINDMVEQFSSVLLMASAAMGVQRLLLSISAWWPFSLLLITGLIAWWWAHWFLDRGAKNIDPDDRAKHIAHRALPWLKRIVLLLALIRFAVPAVVLLNEGAYRLFLHPEYVESKAAIESAKQAIGSIQADSSDDANKPEAGFWNKLANTLDPRALKRSLETRMQALEKAASAVTENVIDLIVIFVLQTIGLPLLFLWGLMAIAKRLLLKPLQAREMGH